MLSGRAPCEKKVKFFLTKVDKYIENKKNVHKKIITTHIQTIRERDMQVLQTSPRPLASLDMNSIRHSSAHPASFRKDTARTQSIPLENLLKLSKAIVENPEAAKGIHTSPDKTCKKLFKLQFSEDISDKDLTNLLSLLKLTNEGISTIKLSENSSHCNPQLFGKLLERTPASQRSKVAPLATLCKIPTEYHSVLSQYSC